MPEKRLFLIWLLNLKTHDWCKVLRGWLVDDTALVAGIIFHTTMVKTITHKSYTRPKKQVYNTFLKKFANSSSMYIGCIFLKSLKFENEIESFWLENEFEILSGNLINLSQNWHLWYVLSRNNLLSIQNI